MNNKNELTGQRSLLDKILSFWNEQVKPIMLKEWVHIFNDSTTLRIAVMIPLLQLTIFGFGINDEVRDIKTFIFDQDRSKASSQFIQKAEATTYFKIKKEVHSKKELLGSLVCGEASVGIIIPPDYSRKINSNRKAQIQVLIDGSDSNISNQSQAALEQLGSSISRTVRSKKRQGSLETQDNLIDVRSRVLFNPNLETTYQIIPGLLGIIVFLVTSFLCCLSIVGEKERGTLEQLLVTPLTPLGLMTGKVIPYLCIGFVDFNLSLLLMYLLFQIPIQGSILLLELATIIFMFSALGISLLISSVAKSQPQATQLVFVQMLPSILLSGYIFPFEPMPVFFRAIGYMLPVTHFIMIARGIILRGAELTHLIVPFVVLIVYGVIIFGFSVKIFKKEIE
ncbi:MAG: ABC transporter permease [Candidatus Caenarcaniphilales bacterium]|nr:ABC transporter permease [Candidatus Caenarcaniphilales bacterium]